MRELKNYVSKVLHNNKSGSYDIITYIDIEKVIKVDEIKLIINTMIENNPILKDYIVNHDSKLFIDSLASLDIEDYYELRPMLNTEFDKPIYEILNMPYKTICKWRLIYCFDEENNTSRLYFKIDHTFADGQQVIKILSSVLKKDGIDVTKGMKRTTSFLNTIYYYIFGTISLIFLYLKFIMKMIDLPLTTTDTEYTSNSETDYILFDSFNFSKIKSFTKKKGITVNDFMYSLMIKSSFLYTNEAKLIYSASPINVSETKDTNNMCPLFLSIANTYDNDKLLKKVHTMFNACKYSFFIPLLSYSIHMITSILPLNILKTGYDICTGSCDYVFSNIIGPSVDNLSLPISNIHFLTMANKNEIIYNIISCKDNINIICTFKKGIIADKGRFQSCILQALESFLGSD